MTFTFSFDYEHPTAPKELRGLLGGKGANLAEMSGVLRLPVPPGFTIATTANSELASGELSQELWAEIKTSMTRLSDKTGLQFGNPERPLLVSVRSGARASMPGMMDTVLNLGLTDEVVSKLEIAKGSDFAYSCYARLLHQFGTTVLGLPLPHPTGDAAVRVTALKALYETYDADFPQDPYEQLRLAIQAVFASWNSPRAIAYRDSEGISQEEGTAVNVQLMVFGNLPNSGTGVGFTRNPTTGENKPSGDFLPTAQGEDVVAGTHKTMTLTDMATTFPAQHQELLATFSALEAHYRDMCDVEFTIEVGKLWILQVRVGKRTARAAVRMAVEMTKDPKIRLRKSEAVSRITPEMDEQLHNPVLDGHGTLLATGIPVSPGGAVGELVLTSERAIELSKANRNTILVTKDTSPDDIHGMIASSGFLTTTGGPVCHAAVVARGLGKPAAVGASDIEVLPHAIKVGSREVHEGDLISLDGTTGNLYLGGGDLAKPEPPMEYALIEQWRTA